ncbi:hypothetical protein [Cysteiniphilum halobium]|uniref:hypothetical protein n=1 Tax=Cysteiniphilum halobium TaxID=2219059 RepID=UPI000E6470A1|nr:hypothetical protein [Cysteiniphilum halobium]
MNIDKSHKLLRSLLLILVFSTSFLTGCTTANNSAQYPQLSAVPHQITADKNTHFLTLDNGSKYVIECTQMIGGYCSQNPIGLNSQAKLLPDPGSKVIRGHIMVFDPDIAGSYIDNILFKAYQVDGKWQMKNVDVVSLYGAMSITLEPDNVINVMNDNKQTYVKHG